MNERILNVIYYDPMVMSKEVQIVYRLFLVNGYLLHGNILSETETDRSIYYLHGRFCDSLSKVDST